MNENLNLMEILKDCPKGTKFYIRIGDIPSNEKSKIYRGESVIGEEEGVSVYNCIKLNNTYHIVMPIPLKEGQGMTYECFIQEITQCRYEIENPRNVYLVSGIEVGKGHDNEPLIKDVKILKDLTEQFNTKNDNTKETKTSKNLVEPKFKVGDIIFTRTKLGQNYGFDWISIFKEFQSDICVNYLNLCLNDYALYYHEGDAVLFDIGVILTLDSSNIIEQRLATEDEKQQLFDTIKKSGYKWNAENRKLDILPTPVNDIYKCNIDVKDLDIVPKFKVGDDIIESKSGKRAFVVYIGMDRYNICTTEFDFMGVLFKDQDDWELYKKPNVFDPSTLIPFESKVLVRDGNHFSWVGSIYTHHKENGFYTVNGRYYYQCIPYNDDTAYLIGTDKIAPDYYRYWED